MRKITANIIYPVSSAPIKNAYLVIDDDGSIVDICNYNSNSEEIAGLEYYSGVLVPGFVNAHCHVELSHLKGIIKEGSGLSNFINEIQSNRDEEEPIIDKQMQNAMRYMWSRGINGLGDIVNSLVGVNVKSNSPILSYNFIELFNKPNLSDTDIIHEGKNIGLVYNNNNLINSLTPHSPYGTSVSLLKQMQEETADKRTISLHFLESKWETDGSSRLIDYLQELKSYKNILLVHNLFLTETIFYIIKADIELYNKIFWVVCPNSNIHINSELPPINKFEQRGLQCCLGTDSLASNYQLSILDEMKTIAKFYPEIVFETLLEWATLNGAKALNFDDRLGSFDIGKSPGVLLLSDYDFKRKQLTDKTEVKRLV